MCVLKVNTFTHDYLVHAGKLCMCVMVSFACETMLGFVCVCVLVFA